MYRIDVLVENESNCWECYDSYRTESPNELDHAQIFAEDFGGYKGQPVKVQLIESEGRSLIQDKTIYAI